MESELFGALKVYCSATKCRFKNNHVYYGLCHNPLVLNQYKNFVGGEVHIGGCTGGCSHCLKPEEDCAYKDYISQVHEEEGIPPTGGEVIINHIIE